MIATVQRMAELGDDEALADVWKLLGGESELPASGGPELVAGLLHRLCGKGDRYAVERSALADVAKTVALDAQSYPQVDELEEAIVEALGERLREKLADMNTEERAAFFEDMVKRISDEDRLRLI